MRPSRVATVSTNRYGLARVHLRYPSVPASDEPQRFNLRLTARDTEQRDFGFRRDGGCSLMRKQSGFSVGCDR
jgi:hypothetical protein